MFNHMAVRTKNLKIGEGTISSVSVPVVNDEPSGVVKAATLAGYGIALFKAFSKSSWHVASNSASKRCGPGPGAPQGAKSFSFGYVHGFVGYLSSADFAVSNNFRVFISFITYSAAGCARAGFTKKFLPALNAGKRLDTECERLVKDHATPGAEKFPLLSLLIFTLKCSLASRALTRILNTQLPHRHIVPCH